MAQESAAESGRSDADLALELSIGRGHAGDAAASSGSAARKSGSKAAAAVAVDYHEPCLTLSLPAASTAALACNMKPAPYSPPHSGASSLLLAVKKERAGSCGRLEEAEMERVVSSAVAARRPSEDDDGDDDDGDGEGGAGGPRKKLRLSKEQSALLEDKFREHSTLNPKQKQVLAKQLKLRPRQVEVWFQNRRARTKLKQTEVDCEFLKRCCESLTEENRRLQRELQDLRALKCMPPPPSSQQQQPLFMHQLPAATLKICPSCERTAGAGATAAQLPAATALDGQKPSLSPFRPTAAARPPHHSLFSSFTHSAAC